MEEAAARRREEEGRRGTGEERKEAARPADRVTGGGLDPDLNRNRMGRLGGADGHLKRPCSGV